MSEQVPVTCGASGCQLPVPRAYERAEQRAEFLRAEADRVMEAAKRQAARLLAEADDTVAFAEANRAADGLPLCPNHTRILRDLDVGLAGALAVARGDALTEAQRRAREVLAWDADRRSYAAFNEFVS